MDNSTLSVRRKRQTRKQATPMTRRLRIESREQLLFLLTQACELEHGLMCEYLFAEFTLKRSTDEGVTQAQLDRIRAWEGAIEGVAIQEMLHLALATNLLTAIGAPPHFDRPNFPILSGWYPPGVQIALVPFGERALKHFIFLERPEDMALDDAEGFAALQHAQPLTAAGGLMAVEEEWTTVGQLYRSIEEGLAFLVARDGEDEVFVGARRDQARWQAFHWSEITPVVDLASARLAIEHVIEQGEGVRGEWRTAHFGIFLGILQELRAMQAEDPTFQPARASVPAYVHPLDDADAPVALITDARTAAFADLFDAVYEITLQVLSRYFVHTTESNEHVAVLARTAKRLMEHALKPIGVALTGMPLTGDPGGPLAGPGFTIVSPTFYLLPHRNAAWRVLRQRLQAASRRATELAVDGPPEVGLVASELSTLAALVAANMPGVEG